MTFSALRTSLRLVPLSLFAVGLLAACAVDPAKEEAVETTAAAETTITAAATTTTTSTSVAPTVPETTAATVAPTTLAEAACTPLPVAGVTDMLVSDAESFSNTLGASAVANWELATFGLECAFGASGISSATGPNDAATPGEFSAAGAALETKNGDGIMPYAVLDTVGNCALRAIVESGGSVALYKVTSPVVDCNAYEALDGYEAGEFSAA